AAGIRRLYGMGEALHDRIVASNMARSRIYAPVGAHRDLLAYLVRRLLENGANSSFVNQIVDEAIPPETVAADPFDAVIRAHSVVTPPYALYIPERANSVGFNLRDPEDAARFDAMRAPFRATRWAAGPILAAPAAGGRSIDVRNPADPADLVGRVEFATDDDVDAALAAARPWDAPAERRAGILRAASDVFEAQAGTAFALLAREAGKTPADAVGELREAVDFLRYYAARALDAPSAPRGVFTCISPWNFPLAIFTGQIAAALAAGNAVLAKPAEPTALIAGWAVAHLHHCGVPRAALQLLPGDGAQVGARLAGAAAVQGVCFTGSTRTAQAINRAMAASGEPAAPLIAETGGLNAMVVDSTALPEQAVRDILASAFQSAGQRCSALRMLYLQDDVADGMLAMLFGAMDELRLGDPWPRATDIGPIINDDARRRIDAHIAQAKAQGRLLFQHAAPDGGCFVAPAAIAVSGIEDLREEVFGPVLHVARYGAEDLDAVIDAVNASGYGLTFGAHSRIDDRVDLITRRVKTGNIYINRNQIGAIVGSQPFGGEGLSGTGPKAGGPHYVARFSRAQRRTEPVVDGPPSDVEAVADALATAPAPRARGAGSLPGPTGESNRLTEYGRGTVLCLGPTAEAAAAQARIAAENGCAAVTVAPGLNGASGVPGVLPASALTTLDGFDAVVSFAEDGALRPLRVALAARDGRLIPLLAEADFGRWCRLERHVCVDTTAAGGNATLLAAAS
ncbi:MAG: bifunctional proline dehydrogenase/L-glutamate gamma-semialdehyde dehydrogenase PutA, partial [Pseudomonadota bacterium]